MDCLMGVHGDLSLWVDKSPGAKWQEPSPSQPNLAIPPSPGSSQGTQGLSPFPGPTVLRTQVRFLSPHSLSSRLLSELLGRARSQVSNRDNLETFRARSFLVNLFLLSCQGFWGVCVSSLRLSLLCDFFGVFLKWLFVILPWLTHLSQQLWKTHNPLLFSTEHWECVNSSPGALPDCTGGTSLGQQNP